MASTREGGARASRPARRPRCRHSSSGLHCRRLRLCARRASIPHGPDPHQPSVDPEDAAHLRDPEAFARAFRTYGERLRLWVEVQLGPQLRRRITSEDVLQETFLEAFRSLDRFEARGPGSFQRWLMGVARNRILDMAKHHRAAKRDVAREVPPPASSGGGTARVRELAASVSTPSGRAGRRELQGRLSKAIAALPEPVRQVLVMRAIEERTLREVGEALGRSIAWAHGRYAEGLRLLKQELGYDLGRTA